MKVELVLVDQKLTNERVKTQKLVKTIFKNLPFMVIKLLVVIKTGQTIGFQYMFTIGKSYVLFCLGVGQGLPHLFLFFKENSKNIQLSIFLVL